MTTVHPRRFVVVVPAGATAWIGEALRWAFACPEYVPRAWEGAIRQLSRPGR